MLRHDKQHIVCGSANAQPGKIERLAINLSICGEHCELAETCLVYIGRGKGRFGEVLSRARIVIVVCRDVRTAATHWRITRGRRRRAHRGRRTMAADQKKAYQ